MKKNCVRAGEIAECLRELAALQKTQVSSPASAQRLTTVCNSSFWESGAIFWPLGPQPWKWCTDINVGKSIMKKYYINWCCSSFIREISNISFPGPCDSM